MPTIIVSHFDVWIDLKSRTISIIIFYNFFIIFYSLHIFFHSYSVEHVNLKLLFVPLIGRRNKNNRKRQTIYRSIVMSVTLPVETFSILLLSLFWVLASEKSVNDSISFELVIIGFEMITPFNSCSCSCSFNNKNSLSLLSSVFCLIAVDKHLLTMAHAVLESSLRFEMCAPSNAQT